MTALRSSLRLFVQRPALATAIVLTLAIGLGSVTAIVSVTSAWLLRPLPFPDAERIVLIASDVAGERGRLALREFRELEREATTLAKVGAYYRTQYNLTGNAAPQALTCTMPSSTVFEVLGVKALHGDIWPSSLDFTRHYTVVLSHGVWRQRFGGRPDIVGQSIVMDGASYRVSGVLPESVDFPLQTDVYRGVTDYNSPEVRRYSAVGRLAPGRSLVDVQSELDALAARFAATWPQSNTGVRLVATPLRDAYIGRARPFVLLMAGAVVLLLVMALVNVANLLLSRALSQEGDNAVRIALGAARWQVVRQSLLDTVVLTGVGIVVGAVAAHYVVAAATTLVGTDLPPWMTVDVDLRTLLVSTAIAIAVAAAIGILLALQASRTDVERVLRQQAGRSSGGSRKTVRRWLVGAQAATASVLLVAAGIFASGLSTLLAISPGFERHNALTFRVDPPYSRYGDIATTSEFYRRTAAVLKQIPGVTHVGANSNLPFARLEAPSPRVAVEGRESGRADEAPFVNLQLIDPGYLDAMGISLLRGRSVERTDDQTAPLVGLVSQRAARRFWGEDDPLGRRLRLVWNQNGVGTGGGSELWLTVVGVVGSIQFGGVHDVSGLDVYAPHMQMFAGDSFFVIRTRTDPQAIQSQIRSAIDHVDRDQSFFDVTTLDDRIARTLWQHRVATVVLGFFAAVALTLAVVGTNAVTAHAVASQRREIGIRRALGSSGARVGWLVARQWLVPVITGVVIGIGGGFLAAQRLAMTIGVPGAAIGWPILLPAGLTLAAAAACALPIAMLLRRTPLTEALRAD
jgi:predicted permease